MRDIQDYEIKYQEEPCEKFQVKYRRKKILELLNTCNHETILEIGCGMEPLFEYVKDYKQMVIVEPGDMFIQNAARKAEKSGSNVVCIQGFFEEKTNYIKEICEKYDFIVLSSLLHEVEEPENLLKTIHYICSDDTIVHINVPNANSLHRLLAKEMGLIGDVHELSNLQKAMQRNRVFDLNGLCDIVVKCGFEVLQKGTYFPKFLSAGQMEKMLQQDIVKEDIFDGLDKMIKYVPEFGSEIFVQVKRSVENEKTGYCREHGVCGNCL